MKDDRTQKRHKYGISKTTAIHVRKIFQKYNRARSPYKVHDMITLTHKSSAVSILHFMDWSDEFEQSPSVVLKNNRVGTMMFRMVKP